MIRHPLEKLIVELLPLGSLDVKLGRDTFTIHITRVKNSMADSLPYPNLPKEVMSVLPFDSCWHFLASLLLSIIPSMMLEMLCW
jgi:hypothetical protein